MPFTFLVYMVFFNCVYVFSFVHSKYYVRNILHLAKGMAVAKENFRYATYHDVSKIRTIE